MASGDETAGRPFTIRRADETLPPQLRGGIAAIGNFDGVHRGHRALVEAVRQQAGARPALVLTFEPHPRAFFAPDLPMFRLTGPRAKEIVFARLGRAGLLDGLVVRRFDAALARTGARAFVERLLRAELGLAGVVIGHDFHFGRRREGTPAVLAELCRETGLSCRIVEPVTLGAEAEPISSSGIRRALAAGAIDRANALPDCDLAHGIYAVRVRLPDGTLRDGVASYGRRPTFDDGAPLLEANLFDFAGDLYGQEIAVEFVAHIRGEERFASAEALVARMDIDAAEARRRLAADPVPSMLD